MAIYIRTPLQLVAEDWFLDLLPRVDLNGSAVI
jgi:hypothetical protein